MTLVALLGAPLSVVACSGGGAEVQGAALPDAGPGEDEAPPVVDASAAPEIVDAGSKPAREAGPQLPYGATCKSGDDCASGICRGLVNGPSSCTVDCSPQTPNSCRAVGGLCLGGKENGVISYACGKTGFDTGVDTSDDAILALGDSVTRYLDSLSDVDMFELTLPTGTTRIAVTPASPSFDVAFDFYNAQGALASAVSNHPAGQEEGLTINGDNSQGLPYHQFVIVKAVGAVAGKYTISFKTVP